MKRLILLLMLAASPLYATKYYVSATGNDAANGTSTATPWASLHRIGRTAYAPDDTIALKCGDWFEGQILDTLVGSLGHPVVVTSYGTGARPIIYGDMRGRTWTPVYGHAGIYKSYLGGYSTLPSLYQYVNGAWTGSTGTSYIAYRGSNPANDNTWFNQLPEGGIGVCYHNDTVFVHTYGNVTFPATRDSIRVYRGGSSIMAGSSDYIIRGIDFQRIRSGFSLYGVRGRATNLHTQATLSTGLSLVAMSYGSIDSCVTDSSGDTGIYLIQSHHGSCRYNTIKNTTRTVDGLSLPDADLCSIGILDNYAHGRAQDTIGYNIIEHNTFDHMYHGFIDWYYCIGDTARYNEGHGGTSGGSPTGDNLVMTHNTLVFYPSGGNGTNISCTGGSVTYAYNTLDSVKDYAVWVASNTGDAVNIHHNIIRTYTASRTFVDYKTSPNIYSNYNYYFGVSSMRFMYNSVSYYDIPSFYAATGFDEHSTLNVDIPVESATNTISVYAGDNQSKVLKSFVSISSYITDTSGLPMPGIIVTYAIATVPSGAVGQVLSVTTDTTDTFGTASTVLTLGNKAGTYTVTATSAGVTGSPLTFTATATRSGYKVFSRIRK